MNVEQEQALQKLAADATFQTKFAAASSDERRALLAQAGLNVPLEEAEAVLTGERELAESELEEVAGGDAGIIRLPPPPPPPPEG